jgi:hypothetical protein
MFIYVEEAHALDEWPIGLNGKISQNSPVKSIPQHKTDNDRKQALENLINAFPWIASRMMLTFCPIDYDISNKINSWPFGIWLMNNLVVQSAIKPSTETCFDIKAYVDSLIPKIH